MRFHVGTSSMQLLFPEKKLSLSPSAGCLEIDGASGTEQKRVIRETPSYRLSTCCAGMRSDAKKGAVRTGVVYLGLGVFIGKKQTNEGTIK